MGELINPEIKMKCIWNRNKTIPDIHHHVITINLETSVNIESLRQYLEETLTGVLANIAIQTGAEEKLININ